jgi:D-3-phosphoglycerate dehydrogenase
MERTIVTPHAAGATLDNFAYLVTRAVDNARRYLTGEELPPDDVVLAPRKRAIAG